MRIIKLGLTSAVVLTLAACSTIQNHGYLKDENKSYQKAEPVERTVVIPQNLSGKNVDDYYEVPELAPEAANVVPPIAPPGSAVAQKANTTQQDRIRDAENAKIKGHTNPNVNNTKPVGVNFSQAWVKVGHVLQGTNYKIVEKDKTLGTYFVVDTTQSSGKVKKDMPIYQIHLKPSGNGTMVTVSPSNPGLQSQMNRFLND